MKTYTAHFLIPVRFALDIRPPKIVSDVVHDQPFDWLGHTVDPTLYKEWLHFFIDSETEEYLDVLANEMITKLDIIKSPYHMIYMEGK